ncbi:MAG: DUF4397 domain-containing protein [Bacteroidetes bacterium]|nr:DUF4397 domain-containing protein [Rhodothermia bacterium]MCS7154961.1 DUF4397 domain-containing protein [Bacteroidota bacterium]MCX7907245.1 DUF4397 domain-containing protein [Bacteroidota bacterium]MDW8138029.1 hypothetical protein [Bacteroidota bacterium]MDW8286119.1 hypothetical protein [Bacteroidota bacterium]
MGPRPLIALLSLSAGACLYEAGTPAFTGFDQPLHRELARVRLLHLADFLGPIEARWEAALWAEALPPGGASRYLSVPAGAHQIELRRVRGEPVLRQALWIPDTTWRAAYAVMLYRRGGEPALRRFDERRLLEAREAHLLVQVVHLADGTPPLQVHFETGYGSLKTPTLRFEEAAPPVDFYGFGEDDLSVRVRIYLPNGSLWAQSAQTLRRGQAYWLLLGPERTYWFLVPRPSG